jgi:hypothetical protein
MDATFRVILRPWCWVVAHRWRFRFMTCVVKGIGNLPFTRAAVCMVCERCGKREAT